MAGFGPALVITDIVEIQLWTVHSDQAAVNVLHYKITAAPTPGTDSLGHLVTALEATGVGAAYAALLVATASFAGYNSRVVASIPSIYYPDPMGAAAGTVAGDALPRQVCGLISKKVDEPGRRKGGRIYISFPGEADNDVGSVPTGGYGGRLATLKTKLNSVISFGTTGLAYPSVLHRATTTPPTVQYARPITTMVASKAWATQRRRGSYGRKNASPV